MNINEAFQWKCQPEAEKLILNAIEKAMGANKDIVKLQEELLVKTSTRLFDWLDYVVVANTEGVKKELAAVGYVVSGEENVYHHPGAQLPRVVLKRKPADPEGIAVTVDYISHFLMVRGISKPIEGTQFGNYRKCCFSIENQTALWVVERRGTSTIHPTIEGVQKIQDYHQAIERWQTRPRSLHHEDKDLDKAIQIAEDIVQSIGRDRAAWTVLEVEREYWQARNMAGQAQKNRQDSLGMGWSNHDHHTFRSSRRNFYKLVRLFEILGFQCRERFYAGEEAGWGAQVMENPRCRLILFLDVDLAPHEIVQDFAYQPLPDLDKLGTVGLWCELHGDSIGHAGMHHLEAQFMFEELKEDLAKQGIQLMNPFSTFPYLRQAFTVGENWQVDKERILRMLKNGKISQEQADKFLAHGAIGSHLENLQRREGYKGFNQKNVSIIIKETDPRNQ